MPVISSFTREKVIELTKQGKSQAELARMFAISRCAVQHIIKKFKRGLGRPWVLSERDGRKLVLSKADPSLSANLALLG